MSKDNKKEKIVDEKIKEQKVVIDKVTKKIQIID